MARVDFAGSAAAVVLIVLVAHAPAPASAQAEALPGSAASLTSANASSPTVLGASSPATPSAGPSSLAPSALVSPVQGPSAALKDEPEAPPSELDALVRDALFLDFAGYHAGAELVVRRLRARHPSDPLTALIEVEHRFWPQLYDVGPVRDDPELVSAIASALALAEAEYEAHPDDLRARALYGRALLHDARRLALDGYLMRAGAQSENARAVLEQVVAGAPGDHDSRYLLGNYYYWAGVLPAFLKYINWLWFVPQGDRDEGLVMLREVSRSPSLYAESAQVMLSVIGSHHAPTDFEHAAALLRPLHERYPKNVLILHELVDVTFKLGRYDELEALLGELQQRSAEPQPARAYGRVAELWRARIALHRRHVVEAEQRLDAMAAYQSELPNWSHAWIDVLRGQIADLRGQRKLAKRHYEQALERKGIYESQRASRMARNGLKTPFDPDRFEHPLVSTE